MKHFFGFALMLALFTAPAFASNNSQSVNIPSDVKVGSTQLLAGDYRVTWTGSGSDVQVTLAKDGKILVTAPARVVTEKSNHSGITTDSQGGVDVLRAIQLHNMSLVFAGTQATGQ